MKFLLFIQFSLLLANTRCEPKPNPKPNPMADPNPKANPNPNPNPNPDPSSHIFIAQTPNQDIGDLWSQVPMNSAEPKTLFMSSSNDRSSKNEPNLMTWMSSLSSGSGDQNPNNSEMPEVVFQDPIYRETPAQPEPQPMETVRKVYSLPPVTRMISSSEVESDNKKNQIWRSPLPFVHPDDCPHHKSGKKNKALKKKGRKQRKQELKPKTTSKPNNELNEGPEPFGSLLSSILSHTLSAAISEPEQPKTEMRSPIMMSMSRRTDPQIVDTPVLPEAEPKIPMLMAIRIRKRPEPMFEPEPELLSQINPFLAILSKLHKSSEPKAISEDWKTTEVKRSEDERSKPQTNYNFNVNFTINNNYPQPETRPQLPSSDFPFPIIFNK